MSRPTIVFPGVTTSGGGGGGGSDYLLFSDAIEIGTSGKIADGPSSSIQLTIDSGQAAASGGVDGLIGAAVWNLGAVSIGNLNCLMEWVSIVNQTHVVLAVWRSSSAPTSMAEIESSSPLWLQALTQGLDTKTSTYLRHTTQSLGTTNTENNAGSVSISLTVATDADGYGGALSRHDSAGTSKSRDLSTVVAAASGSFYLALMWGKSATASGAEMISVKLQGEFLQ